MRLPGLPVERLSRECLRTLYWGLCVIVGTPLFPNTAAAGAHRVLLLAWLLVMGSSALAEGHRVQWGAVEKGALRAGAVLGTSAVAG